MKIYNELKNKSQLELLNLIEEQSDKLRTQSEKIDGYLKEIALLKEKLALALLKIYGKQSEKTHPEECIFDEPNLSASEEEQIVYSDALSSVCTKSAESKKTSGRKPLSDSLPRNKIIHDLPPSEKQCSCGAPLSIIGNEITETLVFIPAKVEVQQNCQLKYACKVCEESIKLAKKPKSPIPKSIASPSLLAQTLVYKYQYHLPLYRQEQILHHYGVNVHRGTLSFWVIKCAQLLQPLVDLMAQEIKRYDVAYADETTVEVLNEVGRSSELKSYMWVFHGGSPERRALVYNYAPSRERLIPKAFFEDFSGYLHADGYSGYNAVFYKKNGNNIPEKTQVQHVACWAHARRKFVEVTKLAKHSGLAHQAVSQIAKLYHVEKQIKQKKLKYKQIYEYRQKNALPLLQGFKVWLDEYRNKVAPKSSLHSAFEYTLKLWEPLNAYLLDGRLDIDNNATEQHIKPFATGRKNWLFSNSVQGAQASAIIFSLVETCKIHKIKTFEYFNYVLTNIPNADSKEKLNQLLPYNINTELI